MEPGINAGVSVSWKSELISGVEMTKARQRAAAAVRQIRGKMPLSQRDETVLSMVLRAAGETGFSAAVTEVIGTPSGKVGVSISLNFGALSVAQAEKALAQQMLEGLFKEKRWLKSAGSYLAPTIIPGMAGNALPSLPFLQLFGLKNIKSNFKVSNALLGAYERTVFGNALTQSGVSFKVPPRKPVLAEELLKKSEPAIAAALKSPVKAQVAKWVEHVTSDIYDANSASENFVSGLDAAIGRTSNILAQRAEALKVFRAEYVARVVGGKLPMAKALVEAEKISTEILGKNGALRHKFRDKTLQAFEGPTNDLIKALENAKQDFKKSFEASGALSKKRFRGKARFKRQETWQKALKKEVPKIAEAGLKQFAQVDEGVRGSLEKFGPQARALGRFVLYVEIIEAFDQSEWQQTVTKLFTTLLQDIGATILGATLAYMGAAAGIAIAPLLGPILGLLAPIIGYVAGAAIGGYFGSVLGERAARSLSPLLIESLENALAEIEYQVEQIILEMENAGAFLFGRDIKVDRNGKLENDSFLNRIEKALSDLTGVQSSPR